MIQTGRSETALGGCRNRVIDEDHEETGSRAATLAEAFSNLKAESRARSVPRRESRSSAHMSRQKAPDPLPGVQGDRWMTRGEGKKKKRLEKSLAADDTRDSVSHL